MEDDEIAQWLLRLTDNNRNWGFGLCFLYLRNVRGFQWNHKRVYRVYRKLGNLCINLQGRSSIGFLSNHHLAALCQQALLQPICIKRFVGQQCLRSMPSSSCSTP